MLKVNQSVPVSWPVLTIEAEGMLKVKTLVEEEILKIFPAVPVAKLIAGPVAPFMEVMPPAAPVAQYKFPLASLKSDWPADGVVVGRVKIKLEP